MNEYVYDAEMARLLRAMADGNPGARDAVVTLQRKRAEEFAELTADVDDVPWPAPAVIFDEDRLTDPDERDRRLADAGLITVDTRFPNPYGPGSEVVSSVGTKVDHTMPPGADGV